MGSTPDGSHVEGVEFVIQRSKKYLGRLSLNLPNLVRGSANMLKREMKKNAGLTDHSLYDLAVLGHPYSTRYTGGKIHDPFWLIHKHHGTLRKAIKMRSKKRSRKGIVYFAEATVGIIRPEDCPYAKHVIMGTTCLQSRDFVRQTLNTMRGKISRKMRKDLQKVMRGGRLSGK